MKKVWMLVSIALILAGAAALVYANMAAREASRANNWSQVRATVENADASHVAYRYEMNGAAQRGSNPPRPNASYAAGKDVLIYVNPANPAESLLELPPLPPSWPIAAGLVAIVVGVLAAILFWRMPAPARGRLPIRTMPGNTTAKGKRRRKPAPMSRLQPPPPVKWKRDADDETMK